LLVNVPHAVCEGHRRLACQVMRRDLMPVYTQSVDVSVDSRRLINVVGTDGRVTAMQQGLGVVKSCGYRIMSQSERWDVGRSIYDLNFGVIKSDIRLSINKRLLGFKTRLTWTVRRWRPAVGRSHHDLRF
jgi:hypothetical protein